MTGIYLKYNKLGNTYYVGFNRKLDVTQNTLGDRTAVEGWKVTLLEECDPDCDNATLEARKGYWVNRVFDAKGKLLQNKPSLTMEQMKLMKSKLRTPEGTLSEIRTRITMARKELKEAQLLKKDLTRFILSKEMESEGGTTVPYDELKFTNDKEFLDDLYSRLL